MGFDTSGMFNAFSGTIFGLGNAAIGNNMQNQQQEFMQNLSIKGQKEMAEFNYKLGKRMWNETGAEAQRKQLEKAGLNVALMYGGKGGGGQTASVNPGNVGQGTATRPDILQGLSLMANMKQAEASANLANAQAEKAKAETEKTKGVDTEKVKREIESLTQGINNAKASEELTKIQNRILSVDANIKEMTIDESIEYVKGLTEYQSKQIEAIGYENDVNSKLIKTKIDTAKAELTNILLNNALTKAQTAQSIQLTEESKNKILQEWQKVYQGWSNLSIQERKNKIETFKANLQSENPSVMQVVGKVLNHFTNLGRNDIGDEKDGHRKVDDDIKW